jgi:soluble lytic murein transglycosylase-like protein
VIGSYLHIPGESSTVASGTTSLAPATTTYDPWAARSTIVSYANEYGIDPSLPLAIGWQESGFNQSLVSYTGAIGVMQVEPYTGSHIADLLGRPFNLYNLDDNVHAGVYWLSVLLNYYGGNERLAIAAYYEGTRNIALHGLYRDTVQYVNDVLALQTRFGG